MGDVRKLIEAVERGEFHDRADQTPRYTMMLDALDRTGVRYSTLAVAEAMHQGPSATAAILRAMEGRE